MQEPTKFLNSGTCSTKQLTTSISTCVWRPGRLSETECATLSDFPLFVGALTTKSWTPEGGPKNYARCFFSCKQMQLCIVSFCLAFRFNRFIQIPSHPLIEFVRHGKLDTVCLSRCRNVFSPLEWVVSCAGTTEILAIFAEPFASHGHAPIICVMEKPRQTICPGQLMSLSSLSTRTCV